jgi:hypothetical protein
MPFGADADRVICRMTIRNTTDDTEIIAEDRPSMSIEYEPHADGSGDT